MDHPLDQTNEVKIGSHLNCPIYPPEVFGFEHLVQTRESLHCSNKKLVSLLLLPKIIFGVGAFFIT